jgi:hypothetical protein
MARDLVRGPVLAIAEVGDGVHELLVRERAEEAVRAEDEEGRVCRVERARGDVGVRGDEVPAEPGCARPDRGAQLGGGCGDVGGCEFVGKVAQ